MVDPRSVAQGRAGPTPAGPPATARVAEAVPAVGPRGGGEPSRSVHTARLVSLIVSAVPGGSETEQGRTGLVIRFFTPQGQLITEVRPGESAYEEALRLALG
jgi:hypothetical protein